MPGQPSRPVLRVDRLGDKEVSLSWKPSTSYGDAIVCGYQLYLNGVPDDDMFTPDVHTANISSLEPGKQNRATRFVVSNEAKLFHNVIV